MNIDIAFLLKSKRKERNLSIKEVREFLQSSGISVSDKTIYGWESGHRQPDADTFVALCQLYGIESFSEVKSRKNDTISHEELSYIQKYRSLDHYGQEAVDSVLDVEYRRCKELSSSGRRPMIKAAARGGGVSEIEEIRLDELPDSEAIP